MIDSVDVYAYLVKIIGHYIRDVVVIVSNEKCAFAELSLNLDIGVCNMCSAIRGVFVNSVCTIFLGCGPALKIGPTEYTNRLSVCHHFRFITQIIPNIPQVYLI